MDYADDKNRFVENNLPTVCRMVTPATPARPTMDFQSTAAAWTFGLMIPLMTTPSAGLRTPPIFQPETFFQPTTVDFQ